MNQQATVWFVIMYESVEYWTPTALLSHIDILKLHD